MRSRYKTKVSNAKVILIIYVFMGMYSCTQAQAIQRIYQKGYEFSYGLHNFKPRVISEHKARLSPGARGMTLGAFFGNNLLKIRVRGVGFYEANKLFNEDYHQYEAEILSNFSPLEFFRISKNVVDIYFITGLNYTHINFDSQGSVYAPKQFGQLSRVAGLGIEYIIRKANKTISVFSDATVANYLTESKAKNGDTPIPTVQSALNFGVRIGFTRHVKVKPGF